jgi:putative membrane protein
MQLQSHRNRLNSLIALLSLCGVPLFMGCAAGPPLGSLDFGLPPDIGQLLLIFSVVAVVLLIAIRMRRHFDLRTGKADDSALSLLRDRYARGEIDREDFLKRLGDLK